MPSHPPPRIPAAAGAILHDGKGRILILKPTYKAGWTIPGGQIEQDGESPWEACQREVAEETGFQVQTGQLVCVDFVRFRPGRPGRPDRPGGLRLLFDCGVVPSHDRHHLVLQKSEIADSRWATPSEADKLLAGPARRRIARTLGAHGVVYLEDGKLRR